MERTRALRLWLVVLLVGCLAAMAAAQRTVRVKGYTRKDGTYVAPHYRTAPNRTKADNWSTKGNINPYTGKEGTKPLYPYPYSSDASVDAGSYMTLEPGGTRLVPRHTIAAGSAAVGKKSVFSGVTREAVNGRPYVRTSTAATLRPGDLIYAVRAPRETAYTGVLTWMEIEAYVAAKAVRGDMFLKVMRADGTVSYAFVSVP